ncbi:NUDIX hydrolase [uncultured Algimonas sp.]|uniref:NUDIX hydrolase n=1 Tax=uncultured Algimonas sp. TaxID=1547920 RepID=UPI00261E824B|nr:NUDIX hydrolase [uncultured Algimonas sp.]
MTVPVRPAKVSSLHLTDRERSARKTLDRAPRPRIAATVALTIGDPRDPKILMGQRSSRHDFMPSVYVFPGGRVDRIDSYAPYAGDLSARTERVLEAAVSPRKARAIALSCIRETYEETGLMIGTPADGQVRNMKNPTYDAFRQAGMLPDISRLEVFGRAITPPHRHKRFDAWFFHRHLGDSLDPETPPEVNDSHELLNVGWFSFEDIKTLKLQRATVMMMDVFRDHVRRDTPDPAIFFSRAKHGTYREERFP